MTGKKFSNSELMAIKFATMDYTAITEILSAKLYTVLENPKKIKSLDTIQLLSYLTLLDINSKLDEINNKLKSGAQK